TTTKIDGITALFIAHLVSSVMYHAERDKEKCDLHSGKRRVLVKWKARISLRLNRTPQRSNDTGLVRRRSLNGTTLSKPDWRMFAKCCLAVRKNTYLFPLKRKISLCHDLRYPPLLPSTAALFDQTRVVAHTSLRASISA